MPEPDFTRGENMIVFACLLFGTLSTLAILIVCAHRAERQLAALAERKDAERETEIAKLRAQLDGALEHIQAAKGANPGA